MQTSNPDKVRRNGRCPLTPQEVGLMLRALGFGSDVHLYVASGEVYGGEETLAPLKELFPNFHSKDTLASKEELAPFSSFSSRMAALDFMVSDESDVFVTNNNGNMARMLAGRRYQSSSDSSFQVRIYLVEQYEKDLVQQYSQSLSSATCLLSNRGSIRFEQNVDSRNY